MLTDSSTRLNKYISESGICSRRDADRYIEQGNVFINGKRATVGAQVFAGDVVKVNGQLIEPRDEDDLVLIALNKPVGIITTMEEGERDNISDFVNHSKRVFPIGRLDKDSQGLIFLTNHVIWSTKYCGPVTITKKSMSLRSTSRSPMSLLPE